MSESEPQKDYVILLHGMFHYTFYMKSISKALTKAGYEVIDFHYPLRKLSIKEISQDQLDKCIKERCTDKKKKIHFVAYSLGGILVREYLSDHHLPHLGRIVMISTPNQGSEVANFLEKNFFYRFIFGRPGQNVSIGNKHIKSLPQEIKFELGIIAGDKNFGFLSSRFIKEANDGLVSVESTKLEGMKDHIVIHDSHFLMIYNKTAISQTLSFLKNGKFQR